jgi:hypothetical protein
VYNNINERDGIYCYWFSHRSVMVQWCKPYQLYSKETRRQGKPNVQERRVKYNVNYALGWTSTYAGTPGTLTFSGTFTQEGECTVRAGSLWPKLSWLTRAYIDVIAPHIHTLTTMGGAGRGHQRETVFGDTVQGLPCSVFLLFGNFWSILFKISKTWLGMFFWTF